MIRSDIIRILCVKVIHFVSVPSIHSQNDESQLFWVVSADPDQNAGALGTD